MTSNAFARRGVGRFVLSLLVLAGLMWISSAAEAASPAPLAYFGYAQTERCAVDPYDAAATGSYSHETESWSNIVELCVFDPADGNQHVLNGLKAAHDAGASVILAVEPILFQPNLDGSGNCLSTIMAYDGNCPMVLRKDPNHPNDPQPYQVNWNTLVTTLVNYSNHYALPNILAIYVADEPTWTGISSDQLQNAVDEICYASTPCGSGRPPGAPLITANVMIIEAHQVLDDNSAGGMLDHFIVPSNVDVIGMSHYAVQDPSTDVSTLPTYVGYRDELTRLRSKKTPTNPQGIMVVMEGQWPAAYGNPQQSSLMASVACNYYKLVLNQDTPVSQNGSGYQDIVGMITYTWPGNRTPAQLNLGSRELVLSSLDGSTTNTYYQPTVQAAHQAIGQWIVAGGPAPSCP